MNLLRSHILGFGKLRNRNFEFQNGLNLIFAANEGGKSTLQRFLVASLYGQLRSDLKVQRSFHRKLFRIASSIEKRFATGIENPINSFK